MAKARLLDLRNQHKHLIVFFFFQAEDGIRDVAVTGVQTCALPILATADDQAWTHLLGHQPRSSHEMLRSSAYGVVSGADPVRGRGRAGRLPPRPGDRKSVV